MMDPNYIAIILDLQHVQEFLITQGDIFSINS